MRGGSRDAPGLALVQDSATGGQHSVRDDVSTLARRRRAQGTAPGSRGTAALGVLLCAAVVVSSCGPTESMPSPASVWLTSDPERPARPVRVEMTIPDQPDFHREHTFVPGEDLRGSFPVSEGRYRLTGMGGACVLDVLLGANREADVVIRLDGAGGCVFLVAAEHGYGVVTHDEPSVLVAP